MPSSTLLQISWQLDYPCVTSPYRCRPDSSDRTYDVSVPVYDRAKNSTAAKGVRAIPPWSGIVARSETATGKISESPSAGTRAPRRHDRFTREERSVSHRSDRLRIPSSRRARADCRRRGAARRRSRARKITKTESHRSAARRASPLGVDVAASLSDGRYPGTDGDPKRTVAADPNASPTVLRLWPTTTRRMSTRLLRSRPDNKLLPSGRGRNSIIRRDDVTYYRSGNPVDARRRRRHAATARRTADDSFPLGPAANVVTYRPRRFRVHAGPLGRDGEGPKCSPRY